MASRGGYVLLAHGSTDIRHRRDLGLLAEAVANRVGAEVLVAYLDHHGPDARSVAARLLAGGYGHAWVLPVFTARAYHFRVDVPIALAQMRDTGLAVTQVEPGFAGNPALVAAALSAHQGEGPIVLFAAGSGNREACHRLSDQAMLATSGPVATAFLSGGPPLEEALLLADLSGGTVNGTHARPVIVPFVVASGILRDQMVRAAAEQGLRLSPGSLCDNRAVADLAADLLIAASCAVDGPRGRPAGHPFAGLPSAASNQ
jgi:sirohydrochlorin ferrochelatase